MIKKYVILFMFFLTFSGIGYGVWVNTRPINYFTSPYYKVYRNENNDDITLTPKDGVNHEITIIYLDDYGKTNVDAFNMIANTTNQKVQMFPLNAKILIPQAAKITLDAL